jgi:hypothetical protein
MAITSVGSGVADVSLDTPVTLDTETVVGVYVLVVDMNEMVNGDIVVLTIKTKYASGGTSRVAYKAIFAHIQAEPIKYSVPIPIDTEIVCILEQTDGTARDFPWNLLRM